MKETIKSMQGLAEPFLAFLRWEASSGVILLACAILALIVANSPLSESYEHLLHYPIAVGAGEYVLEMGLLHWINDG
ncbi:Na+/H+ antiporter NhaA, partial [Mitsuokella multacida]